jgi:hypothetical protein
VLRHYAEKQRQLSRINELPLMLLMTYHLIFVIWRKSSNSNQSPTKYFSLNNKTKQISETRGYVQVQKQANSERVVLLSVLYNTSVNLYNCIALLMNE